MSVFQALGEEHALLRTLAGRLERGSADADERAAARETRNLLLILLRALEAHERIELLLFAGAEESSSARARKALALDADRNRILAALREEAYGLLEAPPAPLRALALRLAHLLRRQLEAEERELWPSVHACAGRSTLRRLSWEVRGQVRAMERELDVCWAAVADYLTGDR